MSGAQGPPAPNGAPSMNFPMTGPGPQQNGIPGTPAGPPAQGSAPPQSGNFQMSGQRPGGPQQRGPANGAQFQSPTMAHSPQNSGGGPGQQQQPPMPPMGQLGQSPHMTQMQRGGNMLPPNGAQGPQQAANPAIQQFQRPPSRTASPSNLMPSPSMQARQPQPPGSPQEAAINNELSRHQPPLVSMCKNELGMDNRELNTLNMEEKVLHIFWLIDIKFDLSI